jgi:hypothetical protein
MGDLGDTCKSWTICFIPSLSMIPERVSCCVGKVLTLVTCLSNTWKKEWQGTSRDNAEKKQIHNAPAVCSKFAGCCQILPVQRYRHSYTMTQIAPISSPWTTRSVPSIRFSQHLLWGPLPFAAPCGDTILLFPLNQFILAMKLPLLLVLGRYFVYDSEVQLLCLVDSQVHLWEQVTRPASTADWLDRLHRINIYQHLSTSINIYHIFLNILTYSKIF